MSSPVSWAVAQERRLRQSGPGVAQGEIESFDEGGVERARQSEGLETLGEMGQVAPTHEAFDELELATAIGLFDLTLEQIESDLPTGLAGGGSVDQWPKWADRA